ncbi:DedA family protein [Neorhizobium sp. LjRoot104]|uniref:DedA family protein n=1 Tax=Neorhizobium sp. LjRoot104 TaxID=3342254 RepID=UPI003ED10C41
MAEQLFILIDERGVYALFIILMVNCLGVPFPTSLIMLAIGSLAEQGELAFLPFFLAGLSGAVAGDQAGYFLGRLASSRLFKLAKSSEWLEKALKKAEQLETRWGDAGIFFSRWLLSPLGPYVNLFAGMNRYSWIRFSIWDALGEAIWVGGYMSLGVAFSRSIQAVADLLGNVTWLAASVFMTVLFGWKLFSLLASRKRAASP